MYVFYRFFKYVVITPPDKFYVVSRKQVNRKNRWAATGFDQATVVFIGLQEVVPLYVWTGQSVRLTLILGQVSVKWRLFAGLGRGRNCFIRRVRSEVPPGQSPTAPPPLTFDPPRPLALPPSHPAQTQHIQSCQNRIAARHLGSIPLPLTNTRCITISTD